MTLFSPYPGLSIRTHEVRRILGRVFFFTSDMSGLILGYSLAYFFRFFHGPFLSYFPITKGLPPLEDYVLASPILLLVWAFALIWVDAYKRLNLPALDEIIRLFRAGIVGTLLSMAAMFLYRESSYSRLVFLLGGCFSVIFIYGFRVTLKFTYLSWVRRNRKPLRVLIVGRGYLAQSLKRIMERQGDRAILKLPSFDLLTLERTVVRSRIHEILIADQHIPHKKVASLAVFCENHGVTFRIVPDILEIRMGEVIMDESLGIPTLQLKPVSLHGTAFLAKRIVDVMVASLLMGIFFIPLFLIFILIYGTSPGPVFYRHERIGYGGRRFSFFKFRTMVQNADELLDHLKAKSDRGGPVFKMKQDPRVTLIGKYLRRFSIDEIPQLINVLKGEMSLVGPRPQVVWEAMNYDEWAKKRLNVLPGITGLWQVSGRAELTFEEMIDLDIYYIEHWSPGLDLKIILKTLPAILAGKGAY